MKERGRWPFGLRLVVTLALLLLPLFSRAQDAIILIQHEQAGPNLPSADVIHGEWIRWPTDQEGRNNRILALASGVDLQGELADMGFKPVGDGRMSRNAQRLQARGFFDARRSYLQGVPTTIVANANQGVSSGVLFLALDEPERVIRTQPFGKPFPAAGLVAYEALNWDDATAVAQRVTGRSLIVEYPPADKDGWSRFWLRGSWPSGVPIDAEVRVPGLIPARRALDLLLHPKAFEWKPSNPGQWGGPNRWLEHGRTDTPVVLACWAVLATFVIAWALAQVMNEDRGPFVSELLVLVVLSPAALVILGTASRFGGLEAWPFWLLLSMGATYAASLLVGLGVRRSAPDAHPLLASCLVGLAVFVISDPLWSDLSGRFGTLETDVPGLALGAFVGYLAGTMAFAPGRWMGRAIAGAALLWGASTRPWWIDGHSALLTLPAVALLAAEGLFRPVLLAVLALLPTNLVRVAREGVAWNAGGLLAYADQGHALDLWLTAKLLGSPEWGGFLAFSACVALIGNRFLAYRLRRLLRLDPRLRALPWAAAGTLALGVTEPIALAAAPIVAFGALTALAYDGLRSNA